MSHLHLFIMFCPAVIFLLQAARVSAMSRRGFYSGCFVILCTQSRCLRNQTSQRAVGRNWWRSGPGTAAWFLEIIHLHLTVFLLSTKHTDAICSCFTRQSLLLFWKFCHCQAASPDLSLWILTWWGPGLVAISCFTSEDLTSTSTVFGLQLGLLVLVLFWDPQHLSN